MNDGISISLGSFNRITAQDAATTARSGIDVKCIGKVGAPVLQICPQQSDLLTEASLDRLMESFPGVEIRFHSNIHVITQRVLRDVIDFDADDVYWKRMKALGQHAGVTSYSAHAGFREKGSMKALFEQQQRMTDFLSIPVALEGHYPVRGNRFLASEWSEWEAMHNSGLPFVVDVSHAAIIANIKRERNDDLIGAMLASERCQEIHVSGNNEIADQHTELSGREWWWKLLSNRNPKSHIFYEGFYKKNNTSVTANAGQ
jgi:hypothetical protein